MTTPRFSFQTMVEWCAFIKLLERREIPRDDVEAYFASNVFDHITPAPSNPEHPSEDDVIDAVLAIVNQIEMWHLEGR